ncbi:succinylglutamate desuccinylase [Vibrio nigripulchritudo ATCC 27043]|uniref:succinylglutamate desuccinylase n=1 Tax=Vibrio nigripulchritudo TaxID=28173 RepID=UPI00021C29EE|nr:succinylglutamate desuccinylase [Vibrio nigripulchritudo]EGU60338.1 succinylglutamate desuccinylase [Vibrio nigripulchritudo ATCC 27043]
MQGSFFNHSFLYDTLDTDSAFESKTLTLSSGQLNWIDRGVLLWEPVNTSPESRQVIISAGIHGDETAPMELVDRLVNDIVSDAFQPSARCLFILGHPQATNQHTRFVTENLNRLFDETERPETIETEIAQKLKKHVKAFYEGTEQSVRWHLDLHCAIRASEHFTFAVSPYVDHPVRSRALCEFLEAGHIEALLLSNSPTSTFSWHTGHFYGAQALTMELGRVSKLGENDLSVLSQFDSATRALISHSSYSEDPKPMKVYAVNRTIIKHHLDFSFTFKDDVANFTRFDKGELLGFDGDELLYAEAQSEAIVFPNPKVALGQRAVVMVLETETRFENEQLVSNNPD